MRAVAVRRILGLLALAKPLGRLFLYRKPQRFIGCASRGEGFIHRVVGSIAEGLLLRMTAGAPVVLRAGCEFLFARFFGGYFCLHGVTWRNMLKASTNAPAGNRQLAGRLIYLPEDPQAIGIVAHGHVHIII